MPAPIAPSAAAQLARASIAGAIWQRHHSDTPTTRAVAHASARGAIRLAWALLGRGEPPAGWWDTAAARLVVEHLAAAEAR